MGPLIPNEIIGAGWNNVIALLIGMAFGFVLEASGFSSSRKIIGTFFGYDFVVLRVFFTAAITANAGLLLMDYFGWVDFSQLYVHPTYVSSAIAGGIIMGIGFSLGGYCPGTSYCAVAIGKLDALMFSLGLFLGIFVFTLMFPWMERMFDSGYRGYIKLTDSIGINDNVFVFIMIVMALGMFFGAAYVQRKVKKVEY